MPRSPLPNVDQLAFAFRGYNVTNLGRTAELLAHSAYGPVVRDHLARGSALASEILRRKVDLVRDVEEKREPGMAAYGEALALVFVVGLAQIQLLRQFHGVEFREAKLAYGYSLGELTAVTCAGVFAPEDTIMIPVALADDAAELAKDVTMGVLFSRGPALDERSVVRLCQQITAEGHGTLGVSSILSPNTYLLLGQNETVQHFLRTMHTLLPAQAQVRINDQRWPPMHTPIIRQKHIPDRASILMEKLPGGLLPPCPPVLSLVTGKRSYDDMSARDLLRQWIDHPQRLWDAVCATLSAGVSAVIHVGPEPNLIPATFRRLSDNVHQQTSGYSWNKLGMRAVSGLARRPWLSALLPAQATLLRAPLVQHVMLEDWLLENPPR